jgi:hypothetical protein
MATVDNEPLFITKTIHLTQTIIVIPSDKDIIVINLYHHYWDFFHTMAEKIKDQDFVHIGKELVGIIIRLVSTLQCKACREDAEKYALDHNFHKISTKEELKLAMFDFHNYVNKKLEKPLFTQTQLNEKYAAMDAIITMKSLIINLQKDYKYDLFIYDNEVRTPFLMYVKRLAQCKLQIFHIR